MFEKIEKLQIFYLGALLALGLVISTRIVTKNFNNNVISVTGSAYEIVKSDSGTLNFDINVKSQNKQEAYNRNLKLTYSGNAIHARIKIASYPVSKENALKVAYKLFDFL